MFSRTAITDWVMQSYWTSLSGLIQEIYIFKIRMLYLVAFGLMSFILFLWEPSRCQLMMVFLSAERSTWPLVSIASGTCGRLKLLAAPALSRFVVDLAPYISFGPLCDWNKWLSISVFFSPYIMCVLTICFILHYTEAFFSSTVSDLMYTFSSFKRMHQLEVPLRASAVFFVQLTIGGSVVLPVCQIVPGCCTQ